MMLICWPLTFLRQGQNCIPMHLYRVNVEKSFSQNVLMTKSWNLQRVIKVVKYFSYNQKFVPWRLSALALGLYTCIKLCNFKCLLWNCLRNFHQISHRGFCWKGIASLFKWFRFWTRRPPCPYMVKILEKIFFSRTKKALGLNLAI